MTKKTIEVRVGNTAYGTVERVVSATLPSIHSARVGGQRLVVHEPHAACYVYVDKLPRDIDRRGYE